MEQACGLQLRSISLIVRLFSLFVVVLLALYIQFRKASNSKIVSALLRNAKVDANVFFAYKLWVVAAADGAQAGHLCGTQFGHPTL